MKKLLLIILPISVIIAGVLWYFFGFDGMVMTIGTVLFVILFLAFLLVKWIEFIEGNIKD